MPKKEKEKIEKPSIKCQSCGYESDEEGSFCPVCGKEYTEFDIE
jgi:rRNA maturation endonuclease Nob1